MKPFDSYPTDEKRLERPKLANTRREDGPRLRKLTGQTACAYCGLELFDNYLHWLLLSIDHVIPRGEARKLGIPDDWSESFSNTVLCCSGCNGFDNRYPVPVELARRPATWEEFLQLRDAIFKERSERVARCRAAEEDLFRTRHQVQR